MIKYRYSNGQLFWLVTLRVLIGWYFLYSGLIKIIAGDWTSYAYLADSKGWFSPIFTFIIENNTLLTIADYINMYGLAVVGIMLILGLFSRVGLIGASIMLLLYYLSHPPIINADYIFSADPESLWVDKNLIVLAATIVLIYFPTSKIIGLDHLILKKDKS